MKCYAFLTLALLYIVNLNLLVNAQSYNNRTVPGFFTNRDTALQYYAIPLNGQRCRSTCLRRSVRNWSPNDWRLYAQLFNEANRRGYMADISFMHNQDCISDGICLFHFSKGFLPWHRFLVAHLELTLQKIDHEINPGRSGRSGEFCMGYWDWGYQEPFNNNLEASEYSYVFNAGAIGSLLPTVGDNISKNIPDGYYRDLAVPPNSSNYATRCPSLGNNTWNNPSIAACLAIRNIEGPTVAGSPGNTSLGFRPCLELNPHNGIHTAIGCNFAAFTSPRDPVFFIHHPMVDYLYWLWQFYPRNVIPAGWDDVIPQPYDRWRLSTSFDYSQFCYDYVPERNVRGTWNPGNLPKSPGQIGGGYGNTVNKFMSDGKTGTIPYGSFSSIIMHSANQQEAQARYNQYVQYVNYAQGQFDNVNNYFSASSKTNSTTPSNVSSMVQYATGTKNTTD